MYGGIMKVPKYKIKYRNRSFLADSANEMIENIRKYFDKTGETFDLEEVKNHVNKNITESKTKLDLGERLNKIFKGKLNYKDALHGANALIKVLGGDAVDQEEIKRRTRICASCPLKTLTTDCYACGFASRLTKIISDIKGKFTTQFELSSDVRGSYCDVCGCALSVMIPSKMSVFSEDADKQASRPNHCWVKKGGPEYVQN